ncbi:MAG: NUDIX hydrolase [Gammaproteobacteria bacterium]|nr:MAG: NUDIX hydrolase [Pseudomonadota bacterium]PIE38462.1 MAG: NUDIX hydrolase [Gammaproteobacteria bacterium]
MPDDWSALARHSGEVVDVVRARSLPEKFPYPAPDGAERRDRPAYYYTQSAVIPYRIKDGQPEVMVIGSSGKKHWSVPKGIVEPGLSPEESARQEAWEEAGITGQVDQNMLGSCQIEKWGAKCHVSVFAMKVENQMPSGQWQENHRGRKWVDIKTACSLLKHNELKPILLSLEKSLKQHG